MTDVTAADELLAPTLDMPSSLRSRSIAPKSIQLLLPVWGRRYIRQFLDVCLPTLLAPGNIPALAKALPCQFVFLTSTEGAEILHQHPGCRYLESICDVDVRTIDDLITGDNHSTTITLAYARAVRATGAAMLDTCFFFLISDYVIANGSLTNVLARMQAGASGVLAGNFQVVEQDALETFHAKLDNGGPALTIPAREMMSWALAHLHPATAGNTVNFPLCNSGHSNRLFWRIDENTLLGRFYLMHMICIRPELTDFIVGASCDYSFIPEMCKSGKVDVMTDSDDYLVVEMQPREHECNFLRLGPKDPAALARSLSEWTTARHRENVRFQLVFHAGELPPSLPNVAHDSDDFVAQIGRRLVATPQPYRDHPYWIGAIAAHRLARSRQTQFWHVEADGASGAALRWRVQHFRDRIFGRPPDVRPWHPRWPDYRTVSSRVRELLNGPRRRLLIISATPGLFANWFSDLTEETTSIGMEPLFHLNAVQYESIVGTFDGTLLVLTDDRLSESRLLIDRVQPLLTPKGFILVVVFNGGGIKFARGFDSRIARSAGFLFDLAVPMEEIQFIRAGRLRWRVTASMAALYSSVLRYPYVYIPVAAMLGGFLALVSFLANLSAMGRVGKPPRNGLCSSVCMVLRPVKNLARMPRFGFDSSFFRESARYTRPPQPLRGRAGQT